MNEEIMNQLTLLLNIDKINPNEQIKIISICSDIISNDEYIKKLDQTIQSLISQPTFDIINEISQIIITMIKFNEQATYRKNVSVDRLKYICYSVLYVTLSKHKEVIKNIDVGLLRVVFFNAWSLLLIDPKTVLITKRKMIDCLLGCICGDEKINL